MKGLIKLSSIIVILTFQNCAEDSHVLLPGLTNRQSVYFPLEVGNVWYYARPDVESDTATARYAITQKDVQGNTIYYSYVYGFPGGNTYEQKIRYDMFGNIWRRFSNGEERLWFNFNLSHGSTYQYGDFIVMVRTGRTEETRLGKFENCIDFYFDIPSSADDEIGYVFAPKVGIIRNYGAWVKDEIHSYKLK